MILMPEIYRFHTWLRGISPMIWRRLLLRSDQSVADLHYSLQLAFGWNDSHLNRFRIHGKDFGIYHPGGTLFEADAGTVRLADLGLRVGERFLYEYDFSNNWEHQIRLEQILPLEPGRTYPVCIGGMRSSPPEDCGGVAAFQQQRDEAPWRGEQLLDQIAECARDRDIRALRNLTEKIPAIRAWLLLDKFDRRKVNRCLQQYATGNAEWQWIQGGAQ